MKLPRGMTSRFKVGDLVALKSISLAGKVRSIGGVHLLSGRPYCEIEFVNSVGRRAYPEVELTLARVPPLSQWVFSHGRDAGDEEEKEAYSTVVGGMAFILEKASTPISSRPSYLLYARQGYSRPTVFLGRFRTRTEAVEFASARYDRALAEEILSHKRQMDEIDRRRR
jgi:hypothetical protein